MISKVVEFGDTAFIVLRKKDLKFIHYYHHVVTAVSCWHFYPYYEPMQIFYGTMNAFVHSLMYPYYTLRVTFRFISLTIRPISLIFFFSQSTFLYQR